jgi:hypothetical protein
MDDMPADENLTARVTSLERWREAVDLERGTIMHDLGSINATLTAVQHTTEAQSTHMDELRDLIEDRFNSLRDLIEERPSRTELDRDLTSIRAKAKGPIAALSEFEITGPGNVKLRLFGVSGITIVLALAVIVLGLLFWLKR